MKNAIPVLLVTSLLLALVSSCSKQEKRTAESKRIAVMLAPSGKGDRSYNDMVLHGVSRAADKARARNASFVPVEIQPARPSEYDAVLADTARGAPALVVAVGYLYADSVARAASQFPKTRFVIVDGEVGNLSNVKSLTFRPEEGTFLVGVAAASVSKNGRVGFVSGMDIPIMKRFECGFVEGVRFGNPQATAEVRYIGNTSDAFADPSKGRALARNLFQAGVDVIFHAAGASGTGVIQAAKEMDHYVIGVDTDQSYLAPKHVVTSMRKRMDLAVEKAIELTLSGSFTGGIESLGLKEEGIDYVAGAPPNYVLPRQAIEKMEAAKAGIVLGSISPCKSR